MLIQAIILLLFIDWYGVHYYLLPSGWNEIHV